MAVIERGDKREGVEAGEVGIGTRVVVILLWHTVGGGGGTCFEKLLISKSCQLLALVFRP